MPLPNGSFVAAPTPAFCRGPCKPFTADATRRLIVAQIHTASYERSMSNVSNEIERYEIDNAVAQASNVGSRRDLILASCIGLAVISSEPAHAEADAAVKFVSSKNGYELQLPVAWESKGKAGADALFENPARKSTNVGVTVSPVRVNAIADFGDVQAVGDRLLAAERDKESTLDVQLLRKTSRRLDSGATLYDYEYELDSTRGRKRILNSVTIVKSKLYILNAQHKCEKEGCSDADNAAVAELRRIADSFSVAA